MLKKHLRTLILTSIITILPVFIGLILWNRLPDVMATHFDSSNIANGFESKAFAVFGLPLILLAVQWVAAVFIANDPRRQNISSLMFTLVLWIVPVVSLICGAAIYTYNLGIDFNYYKMVQMLLGALFIVIGFFLPKAGQNYTVGIRLPWTLANAENWTRTHRLAGFLWIIGGALMLLLALTGLSKPPVFIGVFMVMGLVPMAYSLWLHVKRGL